MGNKHNVRGVSLIESLVVMAVTAITSSVALPSLDKARTQRHLEGAAEQLKSDLSYTRGLAVSRNETLRVSFSAAQGGSCYIIHAGTAADCTCTADGAAVCNAPREILRVVKLDAGAKVSFQTNSRSLAFDPQQGTVTPTATMKVKAASGAEIHQIINIMGRVRTCSPGAKVSGYKSC
ncbi:MAG: GspH/FimT family pseudopilin [Burkholderiaceae bacterium]|nr:GspH/FimT family pseudopilin [Burkholderiaceae bacterium]